MLNEYFNQVLKHVISNQLLEYWVSLDNVFFFQIKKILYKLSEYDIKGSIDIRIHFTYMLGFILLLLHLFFSPLFIETKWENIEVAIASLYSNNCGDNVGEVFGAGCS